MIDIGLILAFLVQFLGGLFTHPSLCVVLPRMIRGMILSGSSTFAGSARANADMKKPRTEIRNYHNLCKSDRLPVGTIQSALIHLLASQASDRLKVAVDWTDFGEFRMLVFAVVIKRRAIPIFWWTIRWYESMAKAERLAFRAFQLDMVGLDYLVIADRGFGNAKLLRFLRDELQMSFVIRTKAANLVRRNSTDRFVAIDRIACAREVIQDLGRVDFTRSDTLPALRIVRLHDWGQKEPWVLATNIEAPAKTIVHLYATRFLIEEMFKDGKDTSNGFGLGAAAVDQPVRLSRQFGIWAIAYVFLTVVGLHCLKREWHLDYQTNSRPREMALFRLGRFICLDKKRGPNLKLESLTQRVSHLAHKTGHWDWKPRPSEVLGEWTILPKAKPKARRSVRRVRTERPCDAMLRERINLLLKEKGMTQTQLGNVIGRGSGTVCQVIRGSASIPTSWIPDLMEAFGFTQIDDFLGDTGWTRPSRTGPQGDRVPVSNTTPGRARKAERRETPQDSESAVQASESKKEAATRASVHQSRLAKVLKSLFQQAGITQCQVAEAVNDQQPTVSRVLAGKRPVPPAWVPVACNLLHISVQELDTMANSNEASSRNNVEEESAPPTTADTSNHANLGLHQEVAAPVVDSGSEHGLSNMIEPTEEQHAAPAARIQFGEPTEDSAGEAVPTGSEMAGPVQAASNDGERECAKALRSRLDDLRVAQGLTQGELASVVGCCQNSVSALLSGRREFSYDQFFKFCQALDVPCGQLQAEINWTPVWRVSGRKRGEELDPERYRTLCEHVTGVPGEDAPTQGDGFTSVSEKDWG